MFRKMLIALSLLGLVALIMAACANVTAAGGDEVSLGEEFTLPVGQSVTVSGENLVIKFEEVTADSRCPKGAHCIWAGEAKADIKVTFNGQTSVITLIESGGTSGFTGAAFGGYKISFQILPYPELGNPLSAGDYKLLMNVVRA